jgi:hypothetical protein
MGPARRDSTDLAERALLARADPLDTWAVAFVAAGWDHMPGYDECWRPAVLKSGGDPQ